MKRWVLVLVMVFLVTGCAWLEPSPRSAGANAGGERGAELEPARGTTGVSSGADPGAGITGSDLAPR